MRHPGDTGSAIGTKGTVPPLVPVLVSAAALAGGCGDGPLDPRDELTCTPPAATGCAVVDGVVMEADGSPAAGVDVTVEPPDSLNAVSGGHAVADDDGRFRIRLITHLEVHEALPARVVARPRPDPGEAIERADTVEVTLPFAERGERPEVVRAVLRLPPAAGEGDAEE